jgi:hypothetical protein
MRRRIAAKQAAQPFAGAAQARHYGADRNVQYAGRLLVAQIFDADQKDHRTMIFWQSVDPIHDVLDVQILLLFFRNSRFYRELIDRYRRPAASGASPFIDEFIVKNREHPGPQIAVWPPQMPPAERALYAILDEIVGIVRIPAKTPGETAQRRNELFDLVAIAHHISNHRSFSARLKFDQPHDLLIPYSRLFEVGTLFLVPLFQT